ncbi:MAG: SRPBCC family protein [Phycisphaerales bacterium]
MATRKPAAARKSAISDEAVERATGKGIKDWCAILDRFDVVRRGHTKAARHLREEFGLSDWWSQMVTVLYERVRGLREYGQRPDGGFSLDVQRRIKCAASRAFDAFAQPAELARWFTTSARGTAVVGERYATADGDKGQWLVVERPKRLAFTWDNKAHCPRTRVEVTFTPAGRGAVVVRLTHDRLGSAEDREHMREGWTWAMDSLRSYLETGDRVHHDDWVKGHAKPKAPAAKRVPRSRPAAKPAARRAKKSGTRSAG